MKVDELISQLEKQGLEIHIQRNKEQTSLWGPLKTPVEHLERQIYL